MSTQTETMEVPATHPPALPRLGITRSRLVGLVGLAVLAALPIRFGDFGFFVGQYAAVYAILGLSVIVVTGYAGLISLMPYSFAGIGAMAAGAAMASWGWPFWLAIPLAAVATVPVAVIVGVASVRLKGLYLAIATITFANALGETLFRWEKVTGGQSGWVVERPTLGPLDLASDPVFYVVCLIAVFVLLWMVEGLRTSRLGRAMLAVKDNELEAQALGINVYKTKLAAFVLSGMIAGVGGAFLASLLGQVTRTAFQSPLAEATSILLVSLVVIGGIDRALGAFFGAVSLVVTQQVFAGADWFYAFFGLYSAALLIFFLLRHPGGIIEVSKLIGLLYKVKPRLAVAIVAIILVVNVGGAWLILRSS